MTFLRKFAFFKDKFFAQAFVLLLVLNTLYIVLAQVYNIPKLFDLKWWYSLIYREVMLFCTYFMGFCVIYALPFRRVKIALVSLVCVASVALLLVNIFLALNFDSTLNDYLFSVALQSDPNEVREFLHSYFSLKFTLFAAAALGLCFAAYKFGAKALQIAFDRGGGI